MYCQTCGTQVAEGSAFCPKCGTKLMADKASISPSLRESKPQDDEGIRCPKCNSKRLQATVESNTQGKGGGYSAGKGCLGFLLAGPLGLLCGACGSKSKIETTNKTVFICMDCGNKFQSLGSDKFQSGDSTQTIINPLFQSGNIAVDSEKNTDKLSGMPEAVSGTTGNVLLGNGLVAHYGNYTYFVVENYLIRETSRAVSVVHGGRIPTNLFADKDNLYCIMDVDIKGKLSSVSQIHVLPHNSEQMTSLSQHKAEQIFCYGEYIYYINGDDKSAIYRMNKDGSGDTKLISLKACSLAVYNDKLYFRDLSAGAKDQIKCSDLDGGNVSNVGDVRALNYCISDGVIYYEGFISGIKNQLYHYDLAGTTPSSENLSFVTELGGSLLNIVNGHIFCHVGELVKGFSLAKNAESCRWKRISPVNGDTIWYTNVPTIVNYSTDARLFVIGGMVYFGNKKGISGRMPIDGGKYETFDLEWLHKIAISKR